ncbi:MAG: zinc-binding dehydrogenase [Caldilineaceae bacterium]
MQGIVFLGDRELALQEFPDPTPGSGEVVLAMKASGMCGSDLHAYRAPRTGGEDRGIGKAEGPIIAGHEPCGVVVARGSGVTDREARLGQRVMNHHYYGCGGCHHCRQGWSQLCPSGYIVYGFTGHGGHAPYLKVPASTLVPLPDELSFAEGAALSCGTGTAYQALRRLRVTGGDTLAVFGQGPVGLSATMLATAMGVRVIAVDMGTERLALAQDFGADAVIDPRATDPIMTLKELTQGEGVDLALDCSGSPEARVAAVRATRTWGTVCFVGEGKTVTLDVSQDLLRRQLTLIGSWTFSTVGQAEAARFVAKQQIPLHRLITHRFQLAEADAAYRLFDTQTTGKGVFVFE